MRSLFVRTLLWFLLATTLTHFAVFAVSAWNFSRRGPDRSPFDRLARLHLRLTKRAFETGGAPGLQRQLAEFKELGQPAGRLVGRDGRDAITGEDLTPMIESITDPRLPVTVDGQQMVARQEGGYTYLLPYFRPPRNIFFAGFWTPYHFAVLGLAALLCYAFARHLTRPLQRLQTAAGQMAEGDFSVRTNIRRTDEIGRLSATFDHMAERIQSLREHERRLLLDISHELRSPLARLNVAVELARAGGDRTSSLDRIQREADRLEELVSGLLAVTRAETAETIHRAPLELTTLVTEVAEDAQLEADRSGVRLLVDAAQEATLDGDEELMRRAVENVLRNALKHSPAEGTVRLTVAHEIGQAVIVVQDEGPGVPEEALPRLFEPFYRVEDARTRDTGGFGLGLSIAQRAIALHHGTISAVNAHPGLKVTIRLPLTQPQPAALGDRLLA